MVDSSDRRQRVYHRRGERFRDSCVVEEERSRRASTLIWAGITANDRTYLVFLDQGVGRGGRRRRLGLNAQRYINTVLQPVLVPFVQQHPRTLFMQDNARPHVARVSLNFLQQNGVQLLANWSSMSADLNPIEHLWDHLKQRIRKRQNIHDVQGLRVALQAEWRQISQATIRTLVRSMRRRCTSEGKHVGSVFRICSGLVKRRDIHLRACNESHTREHVGNVFLQTQQEWACKICALTTDNAADMKIAAQTAQIPINIGCFAHTHNLPYGRALDLKEVHQVLANMRSIASFIYRSTTASSLLSKNSQRIN
ncbi:uncharacterized protein LOC128546707 [Mercenaria mercenaria]|uniref:uncharacterized protein LOC128546707 n=1 Tax=Mercenaria mercenaria TaxID=6596 RepID=UPI00234F8376|nr:uncharacterized protein LOC128546707 [Mercenaria mercenaria]